MQFEVTKNSDGSTLVLEEERTETSIIYTEVESKNIYCEIDYIIKDGVMIVTHTQVDPDLGGQGLAKKLVLEVIDLAKEKGLTMQATCSYVRGFFQRNPDDIFNPEYPIL